MSKFPNNVEEVREEITPGNGAQFWVYISPQNKTSDFVTKWLVVIEQGDWAGVIDSENPTKKLQAPNLSGIFKVTVIASGPKFGEKKIAPCSGSSLEIGCNSNCASMVGIVATEDGSDANYWTTWDAFCKEEHKHKKSVTYMNDNDFKNPYPPDFGYMRIGTPINADRNRINPYCPAFDMGMLAKQGCLIMDLNTTAEHLIQGGGYNNKSQQAWGYSTAADLGFKTGYVDGSLSFHINQSQNITKSAAHQNLSAWAKQEGGIALVKNVSQEDLLACATKDFRDKVIAIREADTNEKLETALADFFFTYGTGFVSKLNLGAFGVFKGTANYDSDFDERRFNIGGGASVSAFLGGVSVAAEYTTKNMDSSAKGNFEAHSFGMPANSEAANWVKGFMSQFAGQQLTKLANLDAWKEAFEAPIAKPKEPKIKEREPDKKPIPPVKKDPKEAIKELKLERFIEEYKKDHGVAPPPGAYERYIVELKRQAASSASEINRGSKQVSSSNVLDSLDINATISKKSSIHEGYFRDPKISPPLDVDDVDFGGYGVTGFEYTPWEDVLPELKGIAETLTSSQVNIGYAMVWMSIRGLFGQYLTFCAQYPEIAPEGIGSAAMAYGLALDEMFNYIYETFKKNDYNPSLQQSLENTFREKLEEKGFWLFDHYQHLIDNYDWLKRVPFGAVALVPYKDVYNFEFYRRLQNATFSSIKNIDNPAPTLVEKGAIRLYPIISTDNACKPYFVWTSALPIDDGPTILGFSLCSYQPEYDYYMGHFFDYLLFSMHGGVWYHEWFEYQSLTTVDYLARSNSDIVHILPLPETFESKVWRLQKTTEGKQPDCLIFNTTAPTFPPKVMMLSGTGKEIIFTNPEFSRVITEHSEILLVPIDYQAVSLVPSGKIPNGGVPMWFEPRTDEIVKKLNELAKSD